MNLTDYPAVFGDIHASVICWPEAPHKYLKFTTEDMAKASCVIFVFKIKGN